MINQIIIPGTEIPITERPIFTGYKWEGSHFKLSENGLYMPSIKLFTTYFLGVRDAYRGKLQLKRPTGEELTQEQTQELWNYLSANSWLYLDASFLESKNGLELETDHRIKNGKLIAQKTEPLEKYVMENSFVDLEFNKQGMPTKKSKSQRYKPEENIYFYKPIKDSVARFDVDSGGAVLFCGGDPDGHNASLGVLGCGVATQKNSAPYKKLPYTKRQLERVRKSVRNIESELEKIVKFLDNLNQK